jgi:hypothetical protein
LEMTLDLILVAVDRDLNFGFGELASCSRVRSDGSRCGRLTTSDDPCDYCIWRENEEARPSGVVDA